MYFATAFSPDRRHLVCAGASGRVHVWDVESALSASDGPAEGHTARSFRAHSNTIYALVFVRVGKRELLVTGGDTDIKAWAWPDVMANLASAGESTPEPAFRVEHPRATGVRGSIGALAETNGLAFDARSSTLFSAAGDGNAYAWDVGTAKLVRTFAGHEGYLHCVAARPLAKQIVTGSEDGTARLWDVRAADGAVSTLRPPGAPCGWCSCAQVDQTEDWLVCGWGFGALTTWSLTAHICTAAMPTLAAPQYVCFAAHSQSSLYSVGAEPLVYEWTLSGTLNQRMPSKATSLFGVASAPSSGMHERLGGLIAVCGNAPVVQLVDGGLGTVVADLAPRE